MKKLIALLALLSLALITGQAWAYTVSGGSTGFNGTDLSNVASRTLVSGRECAAVVIHNPDAQLDLTIEFQGGTEVTFDLDARSEPYKFEGRIIDISTTKSATQDVVYLYLYE